MTERHEREEGGRPSSSEGGEADTDRAASLIRRHGWAVALAVLLLALLAFWWRATGDPPAAPDRVGLPAPDAVPADTLALDDFVGSERCGSCHAEQHAAWSGSTHGRAGGAPAPDTVIAPFDGRPIRFADAEVVPTVRDGAYVFEVRQEGREAQVMRVDGVIGGGHMVGGGTQGFVSRMPDGTVRFLPFDWSRTDGAWFCNTGERRNEGWVPITPTMRLADCGDWPPPRVLGHEKRFANCQECHGSQIRIAFTPGETAYTTDYVSLTINCESCHGPGRRHAELMAEGSASAEIGLRSLATLDTDASLDVCFRCHALKDAIEPGWLPGSEPGSALETHYALKFPILGDRPYYPDGRIRSFAYQATHLYSACYVAGSMTCTDCHAPHDQSYRDVHGNPLEGRFDDGQCTACHPSKADRVEAHTFHPEGSPGSRCVACHMPYLQHPELGDGVTFARSDHTIPVPRPAFDDSLGIQNACSTCHAELPVARLEAQTRRWWGELKPHPRPVAGLMRARAAPPADVGDAAAAVLEPGSRHDIGQFQGLSFLIERYLTPDMDALPDAALDRIRALTASEDLDVRALALAALHFARGEDPGVRELLAGALDAASGADDRALRGRWVLALGYLADTYRARGEVDRAIRTYHKALELVPDDPELLLNLGIAQNQGGDPRAAVTSIRRALERDRTVTLGYVNLGIALQRTGDMGSAVRAFEAAAEMNPYEPLAYFNLANLHLRAGRPAEAAPLYERAVELDPGLALGHYYLARSYTALGRFEDALPAARRAVEFDADNENARTLVAELERITGG